MSQRLGLHALVVVPDGGQAVLGGAVAGDVHDGRAVLRACRACRRSRTRCRRSWPRSRARGRARWRGRSTRGWSATGSTGGSPGRRCRPATLGAASFSRSSSGSAARSASKSKVPSVKYSQPRPTGGAIERIESKAPDFVSVPCTSRYGVEADALLGDRGARRGRRSTCSPAPAASAPLAWSTPSAASSSLGPAGEQAGLLGERDVERVHVVRRDPGDVLVDRLGSQLDGTAWSSSPPPAQPSRPSPPRSRPRTRSARHRRRNPRRRRGSPAPRSRGPRRPAHPPARRRGPRSTGSGCARTGSRRGSRRSRGRAPERPAPSRS